MTTPESSRERKKELEAGEPRPATGWTRRRKSTCQRVRPRPVEGVSRSREVLLGGSTSLVNRRETTGEMSEQLRGGLSRFLLFSGRRAKERGSAYGRI